MTNRRHFAFILLLCLQAQFLTACSDDVIVSQGVRPTISGSVTLFFTDSLKTLTDRSGVVATLEGTQFTAVSDTAGKWNIYDVPPGIYTLMQTKPGFDTVTERIEYPGVGVDFVFAYLRSQAHPELILEAVSLEQGGMNVATGRDSLFPVLTGFKRHYNSETIVARVAWASTPDKYREYCVTPPTRLDWEGDRFRFRVYHLSWLDSIDVTDENKKDLVFWVANPYSHLASNKVSPRD